MSRRIPVATPEHKTLTSIKGEEVFESFLGVDWTYSKSATVVWFASLAIPTLFQRLCGGKKKITVSPFPSSYEAAVGLDLWAIEFFGAEYCRKSFVSKADAATHLYELRVPSDERVVKAMDEWVKRTPEEEEALIRAAEAAERDKQERREKERLEKQRKEKSPSAPAKASIGEKERQRKEEVLAAPSARAALGSALGAMCPLLQQTLPGFCAMPSSWSATRALRDRALAASDATSNAWAVASLEVAEVLMFAFEGAVRDDAAALQAAVCIVSRRSERECGGHSVGVGRSTHAAAGFLALSSTEQWRDVVAAAQQSPQCALVGITHAALSHAYGSGAGADSPPSSSSRPLATETVFVASSTNALDAFASTIPTSPAHAPSASDSSSASASVSPSDRYFRSVGDDMRAVNALAAAVLVLEVESAPFCKRRHPQRSTVNPPAAKAQSDAMDQSSSIDPAAAIAAAAAAASAASAQSKQVSLACVRSLQRILLCESACIQANSEVDEVVVTGGGASAAVTKQLAERCALLDSVRPLAQRLRFHLLKLLITEAG